MIPGAAVEAAERALRYADLGDGVCTVIREILEAAAPHMLAGAWSEGYSQAKKDGHWMNKETPNPHIAEILVAAGIESADVHAATAAVEKIVAAK